MKAFFTFSKPFSGTVARRHPVATHGSAGREVDVDDDVEDEVVVLDDVVDDGISLAGDSGSALRMSVAYCRPLVKIGCAVNGVCHVAPPSRLKADVIMFVSSWKNRRNISAPVMSAAGTATEV